MKKFTLLGILIFYFISFTCPVVYAQETYPSGSFKLTNARLKGMDQLNPDSLSLFISQTLYTGDIKISDDKLTADATVPVNFLKKSMNEEYSGEGRIKIDGNYDKDTGNITGTFEYSDNEKIVKTMIDWGRPSITSFAEDNFSGTIKGGIIGNRAAIVFTGRLTGESRSEMADGSYRPYNLDSKYTVRVIYDVYISKTATEPTYQTTEKVEGEGEDSGVRFSGFSGQIKWKLATDPPDKWQVGDMEDKLPYGAMIKTDEDSTGVLGFPDMSTFTMKPGTTIILAGKPQKESKIKLVAGNIWTNIKKILKDGTMEVDTTQAVAGIKGTIFSMNEENGITTLKVYRGMVSFRPLNGGNSVDVSEGEEISADSSGLKEKKSFNYETELKEWTDLTANIEQSDLIFNKIDSQTTPDQTPPEQSADMQKTKNETVTNGSNPYLIPAGAGAVAVLIVVIVIGVIKKKA
jgi:hypothetical protein